MTPLILLPGLACDAELFRDQRPALATRGPVHVADVHRRADSIEAMAQLLLAEHPGPLRLVGASMGGIVALEAFAQAPERVHGLALLGTTARADTREVVALRRDAIALFEQGRAEEVLRPNVALAFHASRQHDAALVGDYLAMTLERAGAADLARQNRALVERGDRRALLSRIACPLLVMCGDSDALTLPECSREIAAAVPHALRRTAAMRPHVDLGASVRGDRRIARLAGGLTGARPRAVASRVARANPVGPVGDARRSLSCPRPPAPRCAARERGEGHVEHAGPPGLRRRAGPAGRTVTARDPPGVERVLRQVVSDARARSPGACFSRQWRHHAGSSSAGSGLLMW